MTENVESQRFQAAEDLTFEVERAENHRLPGADLGQVYARRFPELRSELSLGRLLDEYADRLTVVGRAGRDLVWGLEQADDAPAVDMDDLSAMDRPALESRSDLEPARVRVQRARFVNYRVLCDVSLELEDLTILVGPNGAGKSTLLDGLFRASLLTTRKPATVFRGRHALDRIQRRGGSGEVRISIKGDGGYGYEYASGAVGSAERHRFTATAGGEAVALPSLLRTPLGRCFGNAVLLRLDARQLARPTYSPELHPYLRHDGLYLPSVLSFLAGQDRRRLDRILAGVREVIPDVRGVRMPRLEVPGPQGDGARVVGNSLEVEFGETGWTPADQLSEGTLLTLGLHTVLSRPRPPKLLLFDDVDRGLHPNAQRRMIEQIRDLSSARCQVVCTTHSPYVLDPLEAEAVRVVRVDGDGCTQVSPLTAHPRWSEWEGEMNAGEFWQYAGDDWLEARS